jgi:hypothetical protein
MVLATDGGVAIGVPLLVLEVVDADGVDVRVGVGVGVGLRDGDPPPFRRLEMRLDASAVGIVSVSAGKAEGRMIVCVTVTAPVAPLDVEEEVLLILSDGTDGLIPLEVELDVSPP